MEENSENKQEQKKPPVVLEKPKPPETVLREEVKIKNIKKIIRQL